MPFIKFVKQIEPIEFQGEKNLMKTLVSHGLPVASSCGGEAICGKCKVHIEGGTLNIPPAEELERETLKRNGASKAERLSCQLKIHADLMIDTDYWSDSK